MLLALKGPCFLDLMEEMIEMIDLQTCTSLARLQSFFDGGDDYNFFQRLFRLYYSVRKVHELDWLTGHRGERPVKYRDETE